MFGVGKRGMKKIISTGLLILLGLSLGSCDFFNPNKSKKSSENSSTAAAVNIAGTYVTQGTNPGGQGRYEGFTTITKEGDRYKVHWEVGNVYDGIGKLDGKVFKVEWGTQGNPVGIVTYTPGPGGVWQGTWYTFKNPKVLGTETLTPQ